MQYFFFFPGIESRRTRVIFCLLLDFGLLESFWDLPIPGIRHKTHKSPSAGNDFLFFFPEPNQSALVSIFRLLLDFGSLDDFLDLPVRMYVINTQIPEHGQ